MTLDVLTLKALANEHFGTCDVGNGVAFEGEDKLMQNHNHAL